MEIGNTLTVKEYLNEIKAAKIDSRELIDGQTVYLVDKCIITEFTVYGIFNIYGEESAVLVQNDSFLFTYVSLTRLGNDLFKTKEAADAEAAKRLPRARRILYSEMKIIKFKGFMAYKHGKLLTSFYAQLDNGLVYIKDYYSFGHLMAVSDHEAEAIILASIDKYELSTRPLKKLPELKDMYRVMTDCGNGWQYAEMEYPLTNAS